MDRRAVLGLAAASTGLATAALAAAPDLGEVDISGEGARRYGDAIADIRRYGVEHWKVNALPGLMLAVADRDGLVGQFRFGRASVERREGLRADHLFQIGSISKSFAALCVFRLIDAGRLHLEDDVQTLLPEVPLPGGPTITLQSLLNHSSGLPDDAPVFPRGGDQRLWRGYETGVHWSYSNLGYQLLGQILERQHGRSYAEVVRREILQPLGMRATRPSILTQDRARYATGYSPFFNDRPYPQGGRLAPGPWVNMLQASGCIASTGADMAIYARYLMAAGAGRGEPLLSDAAAARFCAPTIEAPDWPGQGARYANGLAVVLVGDRPLLHHTGGMLTFNSSIHVDPIAGVAAFASTNAGDVPYRPRALTAYACERLRAVREGGATPGRPPVQTVVDPADDRRGRYVARSGHALEVHGSASGLWATFGGATINLEPVSANVLIAREPATTPYPFTFRRRMGRVERVWWGGTEFLRDDARFNVAFTAPTPPQLQALTGRYECDDPWRGGFTVQAEGDRLFLDGDTALVALSDGAWRVGEQAWSPERISFDALEAGRPQRAVLSGVDYLRRDA